MTGRLPLPRRPRPVRLAGGLAIALALASLPGALAGLLTGLSVPWRELTGLAAVLFDVLVPVLAVTLVTGLLWAGGAVLLLSGAGRVLLYVAAGAQAALGLYWLLALASGMLAGEDGLAVAGVVCLLPGLAAGWASAQARARPTTDWLSARASAGQVTELPPAR